MCYSLLILTAGSQIPSALCHFHMELSVAVSYSHLKCTELCKAFLQITSLDFFYSDAWYHIECGSRETASLRDFLSPPGYVWGHPKSEYFYALLFLGFNQMAGAREYPYLTLAIICISLSPSSLPFSGIRRSFHFLSQLVGAS